MKSAILDILCAIKGEKEILRAPKINDDIATDICKTYDELKEKLSPELLSLHQKLVDALTDSNSDENNYYFAEGFKLGLHIGIESTEEP